MFAMRRHFNRFHRHHDADLLQLSDAWFDDGTDYSLADLNMYGKHISGEKRIKISQTEPDPADAHSPYFMALTETEQKNMYEEARKAQKSLYEPLTKEQEDTFVQLSSDVNSAEDKGKGENPWESMINMNAMTKSVVDKSVPKKPVKSEAEKKREQAKQAELEKKAIQEARNELLKPENVVTMQTNSQMTVKMKTNSKSTHIEEIMNDKEGELMGQELLKSANDAAQGSLDKEKKENKDDDEHAGRASISAAMKSEVAAPSEQTENIISTKIDSIDDLFGKSEKQALADVMEKESKKLKAAAPKTNIPKDKQKQQELNQKTAMSLAGATAEASATPMDAETMKLQQLQNQLTEENKESGATPEQPKEAQAAQAEALKKAAATTTEVVEAPPAALAEQTAKKQEKLNLSTGAASVIDDLVDGPKAAA